MPFLLDYLHNSISLVRALVHALKKINRAREIEARSLFPLRKTDGKSRSFSNFRLQCNRPKVFFYNGFHN